MSLDSLAPNPNNPRTITPAQAAALKASLARFGDLGGIVRNRTTGQLVGGHQRTEAFRQDPEAKITITEALNQPDATGTVAFGYVECHGTRFAFREVEWDSETERAANIAANQHGGDWDDAKLRAMMDSLSAEDRAFTGFSAAEIEEMLSPPPGDADAEPQMDRAAELNKKWGVKPGDLWTIGEHRLLCGDSTLRADVERVMAGERAGLCFTSPPYAQQRDYTSKIGDWHTMMTGTFDALLLSNDAQVLVNLGLVHKDSEWVPYWDKWIEWMRSKGWRRYGLYIWDQMHGLRGDWDGRCAPSFELIFHFNRQAKKPEKWVECSFAGEKGGGLRNADGSFNEVTTDEIQPFKVPDSVWRVQRQKGGFPGHPAPFSVALSTIAVRTWGGIALDPFLGSGTTMVACQNLNRRCRGIEISPDYCAVVLERMQTAFPTIAIERAGEPESSLPPFVTDAAESRS